MDKTAIDLYERDARFRFMAQSAVARAMDEMRVDRQEKIRACDVHEVALLAAVLALKHAFDSDTEIANLRTERDHYKKVAENAILMRPAEPLIIATIGDSRGPIAAI